jgi:hypothetical protein
MFAVFQKFSIYSTVFREITNVIQQNRTILFWLGKADLDIPCPSQNRKKIPSTYKSNLERFTESSAIKNETDSYVECSRSAF